MSHAHSDHLFSPNGKKIICSDLTAKLARITPDKILQKPAYVKLYNSGHIFGSTQLKITSSEFGEIVYTGDLKLRDGLTTKAAEIVQTDTLIIDGTYGAYDIKFEEPIEIFEEMKKWSLKNKEFNQIFGGYRIGKAQELIKFLNEYLSVTPIVSKGIASISQIYKENGIKLEYVIAGSDEANEIIKDNFYAVLEYNSLTEELLRKLTEVYGRKTIGALATGWAKIYRKKNIEMFALSDHLDFNQMIEYCQCSNAKKIFVAFGDNRKTALRLKKQLHENIEIFPIQEIENKKTKQSF
ncbi:MAG: hypothetical protein ACK4J0_01235 [Candidatus Anstonellaceae archaeon]